MGFAPTENGLGVMVRVSQKQVVNVAQRGGLAAVLVGYPPEDLVSSTRAPVQADLASQSCVPPCCAFVISTPSSICSSGTRRRTGRAMPLRIAPRSWRSSVRCDTSSWPATGSAICWPRCGAAGAASRANRHELERLGRLRRAAVALPQSLVAAFAETRSHCLAAWEEARSDEDYAVFLTPFAQLLKLMRERAQALQLSDDLYDGLLDEHEPGMRRTRLDPLLQTMGARLRALVPELAERTRRYSTLLPRGDLQRVAAMAVLRGTARRHGL